MLKKHFCPFHVDVGASSCDLFDEKFEKTLQFFWILINRTFFGQKYDFKPVLKTRLFSTFRKSRSAGRQSAIYVDKSAPRNDKFARKRCKHEEDIKKSRR